VTFRTKLLVVSALTVAGAVALVTGVVSISSRRAFDLVDQDRRKGLIVQFERELDAQGQELETKVLRIAASPEVLRIAAEADRRDADFSPFSLTARAEADAQSLDFLDILQQDGTIISSAHFAARFGYKNDWLMTSGDQASSKAFLTRIPLLEGSAAALVSVRPVSAGQKGLWVAGGKRLDAAFLASLGTAPGARPLLWLASGEVLDAKGPAPDSQRLEPLIERVRQTRKESAAAVQWGPGPESAESVAALPLEHRDTLLGALLVATSLRGQILLERSILWTGLMVGAGGILLGVLLGMWTTARVTRPVAELVSGVQAVAGGDWSARVAVSSHDEIGVLAAAFNRMTEQLIEQRDRAIQAERVAAWRELARRLAHELKNPLFPLQITIENLQHARDKQPADFEEIFRESTATLLAELQNLKQIIAQFSDFAKMPKPVMERVDANRLVEDVLRLFDAQFHADGRPRIDPVLELAPGEVAISGDPLQLTRALRNLVLNAMDAMPEGGTLHVRTSRANGLVRIEVSDSGQGLTEEECARLFTPYYTTKQHGTGLGLAIVQSVVSDHRGRISVRSEPGRGATFIIDLPAEDAE
jgi:two-component system nitrogen regulation sensor histidine kinase NtrY